MDARTYRNLAFIFFLPLLANATEIRPFVTDGCTDYRDGTHENPTLWRSCCIQHDLDLWAGGREDERTGDDLDLRDCVAATGATVQARIIYLGVRLGSYSPRKIRGMQWGNAWSETTVRKSALTPDEIDLLETEILKPLYAPVLGIETRQDFIRKLRQTN